MKAPPNDEIRLAAFQNPNYDPRAVVEDENADYAQLYGERDAEFFPHKTLRQWRDEIDELLEKGRPYGKIFCPDAVAELFEVWKRALQRVPPHAPPAQVYRAAPGRVLAFLGY